MRDRPPRRCISKPSIGPPVMSVSTPPCIFLPFFHPVTLFPFATVGRCRSGKISMPHEPSLSSDTENDPARTTGNNNSRASTFYLRPINYEYRPKDCSLSGAYPSVWRTWEGIRFQRRLSREAILSRDDGHDR